MTHIREVSGRRYWYRSRRVNGRVIKEYWGVYGSAMGDVAEELANIEKASRLEKTERQRKLKEQAAIYEDEIELLFEQTTDFMKTALNDAGYYQHDRGEWRRKRVINGETSEQGISET